MNTEIAKIKKRHPNVKYIGVADGAKDNWSFLEEKIQITDLYHATEYITKISEAIFTKNQEKERQKRLYNRCHNLKHNQEWHTLILGR